MDGPQINQKIYYGYAKAGNKLGQNFDLYRSATPVNPIQSGNKVGVIKCVATVDWNWMKSNRPGNAVWWLVADGQTSSDPLSLHEGDYLVGDKTFFVLSKEYQMPMSGAECNRIVSIVRPTQSITKGNQGYIAYPSSGTTPMFTNMPASVLRNSGKGSRSEINLPTDTAQPEWIVLLPNLGGVEIKTGDIMTNEVGEQYGISVDEKTEFGWRLAARQVVN